MKKLEQRLGLGSVVAISIATMLGSGIFVLPGIAFATTGPSIWLAYLMAGLCVFPAAASKSELATAMPTSGGTYVYIERTFGPLAGTIAGLGLWQAMILKCAFALVGFGAYLNVFTNIPLQTVSIAILLFITLLNIFGVGKVSGILIASVFLSTLSLVGLMGGASIRFDIFSSSNPILMAHGTEGLLAATALVFISFTGLTKVAAIAEEIKSPEKNLPRGIFISLLAVTLLYVSITFVLAQLVSAEELSGNLRPIFALGNKVMGEAGGWIISIMAIITTSSMGNAGLLAASRFPFAMSRDLLLPSIMGRVHPRFLTPYISILLSAFIIALAIVLLDVVKIAKLASAFMLIVYIVENVAVIVLRETRVQWYRPTYKSPIYPFLQVFGIVTSVVLLFYMGFLVVPSFLSVSIPGVLLFFIYSRKKMARKGVLGIRGKRKDLVKGQAPSPGPTRLDLVELPVEVNGIVLLFGRERSPEMLIEIGMRLNEQGHLEVAHITEVPEQAHLDDILEESPESRSLRRRILAMAMEKKKLISFDPVVSHDIGKTIYHFSERINCEWMFIEWRGKTSGGLTFHDPIGQIKEHLRCNLAIFSHQGVHYIRKIMVLLKGEWQDSAVVKVAQQLAMAYQAEIVLTYFLTQNHREQERQEAEKTMGEFSWICTVKSSSKIITGEKLAPTVLEATVEYDLFIFGLFKSSLWQRVWGTVDDILMANVACSSLAILARPSD